MATRKRRPGVIRMDELYTYEEAKLRLCIEAAALRQMRRTGLQIVSIGRRNYILGKHIMEYVERMQHEKQSETGK